MTLERKLLLIFFTVLVHSVQAQFIAVPPLQDGVVLAAEYGNVTMGTNRQFSAGVNWYCTWDANNLYLALTGANINEAAVLYLDTDPTIPVNGGGNVKGSVQWAFDYDRTKFHHPIRSNFGLYLKNGYHEFRYSNGAGEWTVATSNTLTVGTNFIGQTIEVRIPWNTVTNGNGRPAAFNWFGYKVFTNGDGNNGTYAPVPTMNPTTPNNAGAGAFNLLYPTYYYTVISTDNLTSTPPFAVRSFTYHQDFSAAGTGGYYLANETLFDLTVNDNSSNNADNASAFHLYNNNEISNRLLIDGNITVNRNLVIWTGSALLPADNTSGNVNAILTLNGSSGKIYNEGRIDSNPEPGGTDYLNRRISWVMDGNITYQNSSLFKELARFSNITINAGSSFRGPDTGNAQLELQFGTLTNNGLLQMNGVSGGYLDLGTRGDVTSLNTYLLSNPNATGVFKFHDLLVGRYFSKLAPAVNGGSIDVELKGNFENYGEFMGSETGASINIIMKGNARQEIIGNTQETIGQKTVFHSLTIDNDNGMANGNAGADVHFVSTGGGQIAYYVKGTLRLLNGDLVTRDRSNASIFHRLQVDAAGVIDDAAARSNMGTAPSSFVDGPIYIVHDLPQDLLDFPVGKDGSLRRMTVNTYQNSFQADTLRAELFHSSAYDLGYSISQAPEPILNISQVHWWKLDNPDNDLMDSVKVTLEYDVNGNNDAAPVASDLRIMHASSTVWQNLSPSNGGSADGAGTILSDKLTTYGWFTFGNTGGNPLPVDLLSFEVRPAINGKAICEWRTATEVNCDFYDLERSQNGLDFEWMHRETGAGNSSSLLSYEFIDEKAKKGWNYYRLSQTDFDGTTKELAIEALWIDENAGLRVYPNPAEEYLFFSLAESEWMRIEIWDMQGRLVKRFENNSVQDKLFIGDLKQGVYMIGINTLSASFTLPFAKE